MKGDIIQLKYNRNTWNFHGGYLCLLKTDAGEITDPDEGTNGTCNALKLTDSKIVGGENAKDVITPLTIFVVYL